METLQYAQSSEALPAAHPDAPLHSGSSQQAPVGASSTADQSLNEAVARQLERIAELLEAQQANPFRVRAYRAAAETVRRLQRSVADILQTEGAAGLRRLPTIGISLAHRIEQYIGTDTIGLLNQLRGETAPARLLAADRARARDRVREVYHRTQGSTRQPRIADNLATCVLLVVHTSAQNPRSGIAPAPRWW